MHTCFNLPARLRFQAPSGSGSSSSSSDNRNLRIVFLVPEDRRTGTYFRYHNLALALQQTGHRVTVYSQGVANRMRKVREVRDGVNYILSASAPGNRWILPPTNPVTIARRLLTSVEPADVYHLFQPFPSAAIPWMFLKSKRDGLFVYDWDDFWVNDEFGLKRPQGFQARWTAFWIRRLERKLPAASDLTTTVSHSLAELALARKAPRQAVIHNGVWPQSRRDKLASRAALNLDPHAFYAGLMGWSGEAEWCFEAVRRHAAEFPNLRLLITGKDPSPHLARYQDIASRVDFLGTLPPTDFIHFNTSLDLGLVPMRESDFNHYRLPFKLTDHLAGGTPVLCSRIGESARLANELEGITFCEPNLDSWLTAFRAVVLCLQSEKGDSRVSTNALLNRFCWLKIAHELTATYSAALSTRPAAQKSRGLLA